MDWQLNKLWSIEYERGDKIGMVLSHVSMISVIAPFVVGCQFLLTRSATALRLLLGLIICTITARLLKMQINSPRPDVGHLVHPGNSGFPSDHSMSGIC